MSILPPLNHNGRNVNQKNESPRKSVSSDKRTSRISGSVLREIFRPPVLEKERSSIDIINIPQTLSSTIKNVVSEHMDGPMSTDKSESGKFGILLNDIRVASEILCSGKADSPNKESEDTSVDPTLLSPNARSVHDSLMMSSELSIPCSLDSSRRSSINSLDSNLDEIFREYESDSDNEDNFPIRAMQNKHIAKQLSFSMSVCVSFIMRWDRILETLIGNDETTIGAYYSLKECIQVPIGLTIKNALKNINTIISFLIDFIKVYHTDESVMNVLTSRYLPYEIKLLYDLNELKIYFIQKYPVVIMNSDITGIVIKKKKDRKPYHLHLFGDNVVEVSPKIKGKRFFICRVDGRDYIMKPINIIDYRTNMHKIPTMMGYMEIDPENQKIFERNSTVYQICQLIGLKQYAPHIINIAYQDVRYVGIELIDAIPQIEINKPDRTELYKNKLVIRDLFIKQMIDCMVGNVDANPTNILMSPYSSPFVVGIDYDISLSPVFDDLDTVQCLLKNSNSDFMKKQISKASFYKGFPEYVDMTLADTIIGTNNWDYFAQLLLLENTRTIHTNLQRFVRIKNRLKENRVTITDDWGSVYSKVKTMSYEDRYNTTYLI